MFNIKKICTSDLFSSQKMLKCHRKLVGDNPTFSALCFAGWSVDISNTVFNCSNAVEMVTGRVVWWKCCSSDSFTAITCTLEWTCSWWTRRELKVPPAAAFSPESDTSHSYPISPNSDQEFTVIVRRTSGSQRWESQAKGRNATSMFSSMMTSKRHMTGLQRGTGSAVNCLQVHKRSFR